MKFIEESYAYDLFNQFLDDGNEIVRIGSLEYLPSRVLEEVDPIAYQCGFSDWLDSEDLTTEESEAADD